MYVTLLAGEKTIINTRYHFKRRGHWIYFDFYAIINCILYDHLHIVYCHCKLYQQFQLDVFYVLRIVIISLSLFVTIAVPWLYVIHSMS